MILAKRNKIGTYDICKISLSCFDDKRFVLDDGVNSLARMGTQGLMISSVLCNHCVLCNYCVLCN